MTGKTTVAPRLVPPLAQPPPRLPAAFTVVPAALTPLPLLHGGGLTCFAAGVAAARAAARPWRQLCALPAFRPRQVPDRAPPPRATGGNSPLPAGSAHTITKIALSPSSSH